MLVFCTAPAGGPGCCQNGTPTRLPTGGCALHRPPPCVSISYAATRDISETQPTSVSRHAPLSLLQRIETPARRSPIPACVFARCAIVSIARNRDIGETQPGRRLRLAPCVAILYAATRGIGETLPAHAAQSPPPCPAMRRCLLCGKSRRPRDAVGRASRCRCTGRPSCNAGPNQFATRCQRSSHAPSRVQCDGTGWARPLPRSVPKCQLSF
jgi:hypothetical protein